MPSPPGCCQALKEEECPWWAPITDPDAFRPPAALQLLDEVTAGRDLAWAQGQQAVLSLLGDGERGWGAG